MKQIFITGATGFIGCKLSIALAQKGYIVHALYRNDTKITDLKHPNIKLFKGDLFDKENLSKAMHCCDGLIHTAAFAKIWSKNKDDFYKTNVEGTKNIIETAIKAGIKRCIFTSSAGVLGPSFSSQITEKSSNRKFIFSDYEQSKKMADQLIMNTKNQNFDAIIIYPTRVYGPGLLSESNGVTRMIQKYINGKWHFIPGDGHAIGNYVFIDDLVQGYILAYLYGKPGEKYILSGTNISYNQFFNLLKKISGLNYTLIKIPQIISLLVASSIMMKTKITNTPPMITPTHVRKFAYNWETSCEKAKKDIGYQPESIEQGLNRTISWLNRLNKE